jgi:DNA protecting protein DprA
MCQTPSYAQPPRNSPNGWPLRLPPAWVRRKRANWSDISVPPASLTERESTQIRAVCAQWLATVIQPSLAREEIASAAPAGVTMLSMDDASPPPCLKEIYDPPLITRVRGNPEVLTKPGIAMVGTRPPTPTELAWPSGGHAIWPPKDWSSLILVFVMSGLAGGVDTASHGGAISAKGKTVGVFGTGVDVIYRQENSPLSEQILAVGSALISEFPRGTFAPSQNFPIRNRIIRGMSVGVVVVEAAEYPPRASPQAVRSNKIATCLRCPATSPTEIPGDRTPSSNRAPCWWRPGKT